MLPVPPFQLPKREKASNRKRSGSPGRPRFGSSTKAGGRGKDDRCLAALKKQREFFELIVAYSTCVSLVFHLSTVGLKGSPKGPVRPFTRFPA